MNSQPCDLISSPSMPQDLPHYLTHDQALEIDQLPLQVLLLTMDIARMRQEIDRLNDLIIGGNDDGQTDRSRDRGAAGP